MKTGKSILNSVFALYVFICVIGCASFQEIKATSKPEGAKVFVNDQEVGVTPFILKLDRKVKTVAIRFEKEGYEPYGMTLKSEINGWQIVSDVLLSTAPVASNAASSFVLSGGKKVVIGMPSVIASGACLPLLLICDLATGNFNKFSSSEIDIVLDKLEEQDISLKNITEDEIIVFELNEYLNDASNGI